MTLLTTVFAAIICTIVWYNSSKARELKIGVLCLMYWGASLMWLIDAVFEYAELHEEFFTPAPLDMLNDLYLGLSVAALGSRKAGHLLFKEPAQGDIANSARARI